MRACCWLLLPVPGASVYKVNDITSFQSEFLLSRVNCRDLHFTYFIIWKISDLQRDLASSRCLYCAVETLIQSWATSHFTLGWIIQEKFVYLVPRTTDTQWRHKSKISENLGQCGRQNMLRPYLKVWDLDWNFRPCSKGYFLSGRP